MAAKCPVCGAPMQDNTCGYCGHSTKKSVDPMDYMNDLSQQTIQTQEMPPQSGINPPILNNMGFSFGISRKSKTIALLLCIFLGCFGAHKFYVGKIGMGFLYLFTLGFLGIGWLIDIILIATGSFKDAFGLPLKN